jgi:uncharacterized membrane protein YjjB (DUF3815 family)
VVTAALAGLGASVAALLGAGVRLMLLSAVTTTAVVLVQRRLDRAGLPGFFSQAVGAAVPATVAVVLSGLAAWSGFAVSETSVSLIVATGIVAMLAGLAVVGSAQDALDGYYLTSGARVFELVLMTFGIVVGVGGVLSAARWAGMPINLDPVPEIEVSTLQRLLAAGASAACFALASYAGRRAILAAALAGSAGWFVWLALESGGAIAAVAAGGGALAVGALAGLLGRRVFPAIAISTAALVPLVPGRTVYVGLLELVELGPTEGPTQGLTTLLGAATVGLAIAAGVGLGTFATRGRSAVTRYARRHPEESSRPRTRR